MQVDLIRSEIPQSALAFIFIGRGSRTPFQVGLYKNFQNKTKHTRITTGHTGLTGRPDRSDRSASELPELAVNNRFDWFTTYCNHKVTGGVMGWYLLLRPRLFSEKMLRPQCVVQVVKRLNVLATCREIW